MQFYLLALTSIIQLSSSLALNFNLLKFCSKNWKNFCSAWAISTCFELVFLLFFVVNIL
ncbi:hypothetical protein [Spiroplasma endosymbiont of Tipula paludosa]|uniref:hypothetical protein n=1 Tax=Spiroplasma endosymbiont of Tipula paludosa TaxID=3066295 RepID=UPI0035C89FA4